MKRVLLYIKGTLHFGLRVSRSMSTELHIFSDSNWAGSLEDRKSTSGFAVFLGDNLVSWSCRKQRTVACSSTEAEWLLLMFLQRLLGWFCNYYIIANLPNIYYQLIETTNSISYKLN